MKKPLSLILTALFIILSFASCSMSDVNNGTEAPSLENTETPTDKPTERQTEDQTETPTEALTDATMSDESTESTGKLLKSDSGTQLNLILYYDVEKMSSGGYTVDTTLKLESYSLNVTGRTNTNFVRIGDENFYFSTDAINYSGKEQKTFTLASHTFSVATDAKEIPVYAVWYFNGTYNDTPLAAIVIDDKITLE